jgi:toxin ParE1/3/4
MRLEFHPAAAEELSAAVRMSDVRSTGLGRDLSSEVKRVVSLLRATPNIGERLDDLHRRFPLGRFPFGLIFRVDGDLMRIIAIAHRRRRPGYWHGRALD